MSKFLNSIGAEPSSSTIDWSFDNKDKIIHDPVVKILMEEGINLFIKENNVDLKEKNFEIENYVNIFNNVLSEYGFFKGKSSKKKYLFSFTISEVNNLNVNSSKGKPKKLTKAEIIINQNKEKKNIEVMNKFSKTLVINKHMPLENKNYIESFFSIVLWAIYLVNNKKENIPLEIMLDCAISLYRAINDSKVFLSSIMINESNELLDALESIIKENSNESCFPILLEHGGLILECFWDRIKPKSVCLYDEQKDIISLVQNNLNNNLMVFYESPPANGKTLISVILAKIISNKSKGKKILLYICYSSLVRSDVGRLCVMHNVDVKSWIAVTRPDGKDNGKIKTFLRPHKMCHPDWNNFNKRTSSDEAKFQKAREDRFSDNLLFQMLFSLNDTLPIARQRWNDYLDLKNKSYDEIYKCLDDSQYNYPEMIISDIESAYALLKEFPNMFVTYFDEAFATADLEITAKIFSVLTGPSILVSATLAKKEEIPNIIEHFRVKHNFNDNNFIHTIKSTRQHISCTFVDEDGNMIAPHQKLESFSDLDYFLKYSFDENLVKRSYSPDIVFNMSKVLNNYLIDDLKFENVFNHYGKLSHSSIRDYAYNLLLYILNENRLDLFDLLKNIKIKIVQNMDVNTLLTSSAVYYQTGKFLHVATSENFNNHIDNMSSKLLDGSPRMSNIVNEYDNKTSSIKKRIESIKKGDCNDAKDIQYKENELTKELDEIKLEWPNEFLINSREHSRKFGTSNLLKYPNNISFLKREDIGILNDTQEKLLFSAIGVYNPHSFNKENMDLFMSKKDNLKGIFSTPSIVYGTNIAGLSKIDIDKSFIEDSSKNILYQLIGRAGRRGKSDSALVIFRDNKLLDIILSKESINIEANKIRLNFDKIMSEN